jgi:mono/diheme cytochrome c family protein
MADGKGAAGAGTIPALADNPRLAVAAYPITMVAKGRGVMPWFDDILTPTQIADVVVYVRTHFGNDYKAPVTAAEVTKIAGPKTSQ